MKLTEWYPPEVKPVREGIYQCMYGTEKFPDIIYRKYKRGLWYAYGDTIAQAEARDNVSSNAAPWRGLAEEPK